MLYKFFEFVAKFNDIGVRAAHVIPHTMLIELHPTIDERKWPALTHVIQHNNAPELYNTTIINLQH